MTPERSLVSQHTEAGFPEFLSIWVRIARNAARFLDGVVPLSTMAAVAFREQLSRGTVDKNKKRELRAPYWEGRASKI